MYFCISVFVSCSCSQQLKIFESQNHLPEKKLNPLNTHYKKFRTHKYSVEKISGPQNTHEKKKLDPRNTYEGTMARWHQTYETHDATWPTKFTTLKINIHMYSKLIYLIMFEGSAQKTTLANFRFSQR